MQCKCCVDGVGMADAYNSCFSCFDGSWFFWCIAAVTEQDCAFGQTWNDQCGFKMLRHELGGTCADSAVRTLSDKGTSNPEAGCCGHLKADYSNCYGFVANCCC